MIAIMTNQGALEVGRSLSGGSRFLAWEAALLKENFDGASVDEVALLTSADVNLGALQKQQLRAGDAAAGHAEYQHLFAFHHVDTSKCHYLS